MKRKAFLFKTGIGLVSGPFILRALGADRAFVPFTAGKPPFNCVLQPETTRGPFYLDPEFDRQDNRDHVGQQLSSGTYLFEMMVLHRDGRFRQSRKMVITE